MIVQIQCHVDECFVHLGYAFHSKNAYVLSQTADAVENRQGHGFLFFQSMADDIDMKKSKVPACTEGHQNVCSWIQSDKLIKHVDQNNMDISVQSAHQAGGKSISNALCK